MKKFFSLVLALVMVLSLTTVAWGASGTITGAGTEADPYLIEDLADLKAFRDSVNNDEATYTKKGVVVKLVNNIDLSTENWTPIYEFYGVFDGNNKTISNLTINDTFSTANDAACLGLFYYIGGTSSNHAVVKNLTIENVSINTNGYYAAPLAAYTKRCDIENVLVTGAIDIVTTGYVGGVVGNFTYGNATNLDVKDTSADGGVISGIGGNTGGVFGWCTEGPYTYSNCDVANMTIIGDRLFGGISGLLHYGNTASNCTLTNVTLQVVDTGYSGTKPGYGILFGNFSNHESGATMTNVTASNVNVVDENGAPIENVPEIGPMYDTSGTPVPAKVGDTYYATLAYAVAAAQSGDTISLLADNAEAVVLPDGVTLDPAGHTYAVTAANGQQLMQTTNGTLVTVPTVTFGDKYDLYLANAGMNAALKLKAPTVAGLSFDEVAAKTNKDGSGNVAYIAANNGQYFVKTSAPTVSDYAVTDAGKNTVLYYVTVAGTSAANFAYEESVTAFDKFSTYAKCDYVTSTPVAGKTYFMASDDLVYMAGAAGTGTNYLLNGKVVSGTYAGTPETHSFTLNGYKYDATLKKNVPTSALCTKCMMNTSSIYLRTKVPATYTLYTTTGEGSVDYVVAFGAASAPAAGTTTGTVVESAKTFDAGIAMYVGMSVMAAAGSAVVIGKKKD